MSIMNPESKFIEGESFPGLKIGMKYEIRRTRRARRVRNAEGCARVKRRGRMGGWVDE